MSPRPSKKSLSALPAQAATLLRQLATEYADATPAEWDELREHLEGQLDTLSGGSQQRRELLVREFEATRERVLAGQFSRQVRAALADGQAQLSAAARHGLEMWRIAVTGQELTLLVPANVTDEQLPAAAAAAGVRADRYAAGVQTARRALLEGKCPSCRLPIAVDGTEVTVEHNPLCPAKKVIAALLG